MLTQQSLKEILHYDEDTGWFTWLTDRGGTAKAGTRAGSLKPDGYRVIRIGEKKHLEHRLAFLYKTGSWPKKLVDHKNRIRDDNRWLNLRDIRSVRWVMISGIRCWRMSTSPMT